METLFPQNRKVRAPDARVAWLFMQQTSDLPQPTSVTVTSNGDLHISLTMATVDDVEAWAIELASDVDREDHGDGTFTDRTSGEVTVFTGRVSEEDVQVEVYLPAAVAHGELVASP